MAVSHTALDTNLSKDKLIQFEALVNCRNPDQWTGFLCILAASSIISWKIHCYYPDFGLEKLKILFSQKIYPSINVQSHPISILFCFEGVQTQKEGEHNHYVPWPSQCNFNNKC